MATDALPTVEEFDEWFDELDADQSGVLEFEEFKVTILAFMQQSAC